jgi:hypothetical protein
MQTYLSMITSIVAIGISTLTLGWTIYRDAIRQPKLRVNVAVKKIAQRGRPEEGPFLFIEALNLGPIPNRVGLPFARKSWIKRRLLERETGTAMIYPDFGHWVATKASARLEIGDVANFIFPYGPDMFLKDDFSQVGVADGFGKIHWSSRAELRKAQERYQKDFGTDADTAGLSSVTGETRETETRSAKPQPFYHHYKG